MNNDKAKTLLYSLWLVPIVIAALLFLTTFLLTGELAYWTNSMFIGPLLLIGYLIAAVISKQKKDWIVFGIAIAIFFLIIALSNIVGVSNAMLGLGIGTWLFRLYVIAGLIFAFYHRKMITAGAIYVRSDEYKSLKATKKVQQDEMYIQRIREENRKIKQDNPGKSPKASKIAEALQKKQTESIAQPVQQEQPEFQKEQYDQSVQETIFAQSHQTAKAQQTVPHQRARSVQSTQGTSSARIDVNACGVEDFLELPGISLADAQRAVKNREEQGNYLSVDDFIRRNELQPHIVVRFMDRLFVSVPQETPVVRRRGRALDL